MKRFKQLLLVLTLCVPLLVLALAGPLLVQADGPLDAVFANSPQPNRVCLGDGTGGFSCSDVSTDINNSIDVALGDVNGDTRLDAVFANIDNQRNRVCLGDGAGGFSCSDVSTDTNISVGVALGDVNGDTRLDAVFANFRNQRNRVCLGDGAGNFSCSDVSTDSNNSVAVALGDVNGNTRLDAVFANNNFPTGGQRNRVCLGDGAGNFSCSDVSTDKNASAGVALGDVNGDTRLDALFANNDLLPPPFVSPGQRNRVCLGDGAGVFSCSDVSTDKNNSTRVALGDVNGDTRLDALFANLDTIGGERNRVCLGDGAGVFSCSNVSTDKNRSSGVALGDVNGDTRLDALFANNTLTFDDAGQPNRVCLGDGAGDFSCSDVSTDSNNSVAVALGDVNPPANLIYLPLILKD